MSEDNSIFQSNPLPPRLVTPLTADETKTVVGQVLEVLADAEYILYPPAYVLSAVQTGSGSLVTLTLSHPLDTKGVEINNISGLKIDIGESDYQGGVLSSVADDGFSIIIDYSGVISQEDLDAGSTLLVDTDAELPPLADVRRVLRTMSVSIPASD